jgi:phage-related protein (TIGR01555 family)
MSRRNKRVGIQSVVDKQLEEDQRIRAEVADAAAKKISQAITGEDVPEVTNDKTLDSFVNFAHNLGIGSDNAMSSSTYGFNPVTRIRVLLEWIHRGSWLGGVAVDVVADDMTRAGVSLTGEMEPGQVLAMEEAAVTLGIWKSLNETIKWARLYGGAIGVLLVEGQDLSTPLRLNTIRKDQFKGILPLDRWMVEPTLYDLVQEMGPNMGNPKYYRVTAMAPALMNQKIHYSRCIRLEGIRLPYWQRVMENLWGLSVLERLYDRMIAFDSATTGAAQLVYKSYIRNYKIKNLRQVVAAGGDALNGLTKYVEMMRRFQGIEGMTLLDAEDEVSADTHAAFGGLSEALTQFAQQLSGSLQIPLVRLFGQSPSGFSTGETDLRNYYDTIKQQQEKDLRSSVTKVYRAIAASEGIELPEGFRIEFNSLWQLSETEKATIAETTARTISSTEESGLIDRATALKELKQQSRITGIFSNVTDEFITEAENEEPPMPEEPVGHAPEDMTEFNRPARDSAQQAAGIVYVDKDGKLLLLRRSAEASTGPFTWSCPGGWVEAGEDLRAGARREFSEETGYTLDPKAPIEYLDTKDGFTLFLVKGVLPFEPVLSDEHYDHLWVSPNELPYEMYPGFADRLKGLADKL